jgi:hypothetical protein
VEILATAIDNLKHGDYLRQQPPWITIAVALLFIWAMAIALWRHIDITRFDAAFTALQVVFIGGSYIALNYTTTYIDLSAPITLGLGYFTIARLYFNFAHNIRSGQQLALVAGTQGEYTLTVAIVSHPGAGAARQHALNAAIHARVGASPLHPGYVQKPFDQEGLIAELFEDTAIVYWVTAADDSAASAAASDEAQQLAAALQPLLPPNSSVNVNTGRFEKGSSNEWKSAGRRIMIDALQLSCRKLRSPN